MAHKYLDDNGLLYFWQKIKNTFVPSTRKVNNKALSTDISLTASDVGAAATSHTHTLSQITDSGNHIYDATEQRTANTVLAAPNGSNGAATFRKLVKTDLPSGVPLVYIGYGRYLCMV